MKKMIEKIKKILLERIEEFNSINRELNRYILFNDFIALYKFEENKLIIDMYPSDEVIDKVIDQFENPLIINLEDNAEVMWFDNLTKNIINSANKKLEEAREIAKPKNGILIFDSQSNNYFLNPNVAKPISNAKQSKKTITWTRIELFGLFINLRKILQLADFSKEIENLNNGDIIAISREIIRKTKAKQANHRVVQYMPTYNIEIKEDDFKIILKILIKYIDKDENEEIVAFQNNFLIHTKNKNDVNFFYNSVRKAQIISHELDEYKKKLINKVNPELYYEDLSGNFMVTEYGEKVYKNLNLLEFLNKDITEVYFEI